MDTHTTNQVVIHDFMKEQTARGNSKKTIIYYQQALDSFMRFYDGDLLSVRKHHIIDYIIYLKSSNRGYSHPYKPLPDKLSAKTIHTYFIALRGFFNWAYDNEYIPIRIFDNIKEPKVPKKVIDILSQDEIQILHTTPKSFHQSIIILLMLKCGLRASEIQYITNQSIIKHDLNYYILVIGKGGKERLVPISQKDADYLAIYLIYSNLSLSHLTYNVIKKAFRELKLKTQIQRLHPHLLRHTFATYYIYNGGDSLKLQYILGHSSLDMVQKYVHLSNCLKVVNNKD